MLTRERGHILRKYVYVHRLLNVGHHCNCVKCNLRKVKLINHWNNIGVKDEFLGIENRLHRHRRPRGPTDKASDYESGDSRFESWRGRSVIFLSCNVMKPSALKVLLKKGYKWWSLTTWSSAYQVDFFLFLFLAGRPDRLTFNSCKETATESELLLTHEYKAQNKTKIKC